MAGKQGKKKVKIFKNKRKSTPESKIIDDLQNRYKEIKESEIKTFSDLPLSSNTLKGLTESNFIEPTDIQKQAIGVALRGEDILGAAKTGSGKTLAFLIPVLEKLYCQQWTRYNGLGAIIITPARELALQIFETLKEVGKYHDFSAALIIGGQNLHFEKHRIDQCNIIICTPGRLLQHMDENPRFECVTMQILVLDEADRCLDMGFQNDMNAIIGHLPAERQTLLFSATQTRSVNDLARLSLKRPMYIAAHEYAAHTTPEGLQQSYIVCELGDKLAMLWSFIKSHPKQKIIVFFSSCKQVKYINDSFCKMRPGTVLLALYGDLHQSKRTEIYNRFRRKQSAVLFATDIAARGLDFPGIHWVVQMDCPEDTNAYIHRAGRTARYQSGGESLLVLLPSELKMIDKLVERKVPINEIKINPNKLFSPHRKLEALLARYVSLKETAQRAVVAYVKAVHLMKDKQIFNVKSLDIDSYARSLGLAVCPRIRFLQRIQRNEEKQKGVHKEMDISAAEPSNLLGKMLHNRRSSDEESNHHSETEEEFTDDEQKSLNANEDKIKFNDSALFVNDDDSDGDEDILTIKRKNVQIEGDCPDEVEEDVDIAFSSKNKKAITKAAVAKKLLRKKIVPNTRRTFDDEGQELVDGTKSKVSELAKEYENEDASGINIEIAKQVLREEDKFDKQRFREKVKEKHREEKRKLKAQNKKDDSEEEEEEEGEGGDEADDGSDDGSDDGPDLSWLPDPDKIYGPKKDSSGEESEQSEMEEEMIHRPPKRKLATQDDIKKKKQKIMKVAENSDLRATEELALQFLQN